MKLRTFLARLFALFVDSDAPAPKPSAPVLDFCFGGFHGEGAQEDERVQIGALRIGQNALSYRYTVGDLSAWGLDRSEAGALACAFVWDDAAQKWRGGKFDWISTSRLNRSFTNIREGYHGWDWKAWRDAKRRAFCIVSADGKRRTNLAEAEA